MHLRLDIPQGKLTVTHLSTCPSQAPLSRARELVLTCLAASQLFHSLKLHWLYLLITSYCAALSISTVTVALSRPPSLSPGLWNSLLPSHCPLALPMQSILNFIATEIFLKCNLTVYLLYLKMSWLKTVSTVKSKFFRLASEYLHDPSFLSLSLQSFLPSFLCLSEISSLYPNPQGCFLVTSTNHPPRLSDV